MNMPPWLAQPKAQLDAAALAGRLPPALLIHEAPGTDARALALRFAQLRFCPSSPPCGQCAHCRRALLAEHPDLLLVGPDPESKLGQISVDQIRELAGKLVLSSYEGRGTVAVLQPAEAMNRNAANALLKTLEEPRADAHLVLITTAPSLLPATVRSRCQRLAVPLPERDAVIAWLKAAKPGDRTDWEAVLDVLGASPQEALEADSKRILAIRDEVLQALADAGRGRLDVIRTAESWARDDLPLRLRCIENCLTGRVLAMRPAARLQDASPDINIAPALRLLDDVRDLQRQLATSLNRPLALERHLWLWNRAAAG